MTRRKKNELPQSEVEPARALMFFKLLFAEDENFKIIDLLAKREAANVREIGRCTGISCGKTTRCLDRLVKHGVVDFYRIGSGLNAYRLSPELVGFKKFYQQNL